MIDTLPPTTDETITTMLSSLNPEQRDAVSAPDGPMLVLAGAGTGKTRVLTSRIAYLLLARKAFPSQILAVTFTNKAAREMSERVRHLIGDQNEAVWMGTFHSISARILRRHAELLGLRPDFTIIDTDDQLRLVKQLLSEYNIDDKRFPPRLLLSIIQRFKDRGYAPSNVPSSEIPDFGNGKTVSLYRDYQQRLKQLDAVDFGDLLLHCNTLFTQHPDVLAEYHRKFRYILVDEYQDTNVSQYLWLRLLAQAHHNICCVGDDDQSIYGWRGAEVGNILRFEKDFPGAKVVRLERNYRSTSQILAAASGLIAQNKGRLGKTLWTEESGGERIKLFGLWDDRDEARKIADEIDALQQLHKVKLKEIAVLVRAGFQTRAFEEAFMTMGLAYKVIGGLRFYERKEVRDVIAYVRATLNPADDLAFERIVNLPKRGIGATTLQKLYQTSRDRNVPLQEAIRQLGTEGEIKGKTKTALDELLNQFARWRALFQEQHHVQVVDSILKESGYIAMWQDEKSLEAEGRVDNVKELLQAMNEFETIGDFLEHTSLVADADSVTDDNMINIMTLHAAKGLEFNTVFLTGWEDGLFPSQRSMDEKGREGLEEERRLAYVGLTRGRKRVYITYAANRRVFNQWQSSIPSRFIEELPQDTIEVIYSVANPLRRERDEYSQENWGRSSWETRR